MESSKLFWLRAKPRSPPPVSVSHIQWLDMHEWKTRNEADTAAYEAWYQEKLAEIIRVVESDANQRFAGEIQALKDKLKPVTMEAFASGYAENISLQMTFSTTC